MGKKWKQLSFKQAFSISSVTLKGFFCSSSLSAIRVFIICISEIAGISPSNINSSYGSIQSGI